MLVNTKLLCFFILAVGFFYKTKALYPICDGTEASNELETTIDQNIGHLMELRKPGWGWESTPEVVLSLQLTKPEAFFGKNFTLAKMREEFPVEMNIANVGKLGLYAMAVQSVCEDPKNFAGVNILTLISRRLRQQWRKRSQKVPKDLWYRYGLGIQALCVSGITVPRSHIGRMIRGQNRDGSYGDIHSVDDTHQALLALTCLKGQRLFRNRPYLRGLMIKAMNKSVNFLKSSIKLEGEFVWIGNKYASPGSLLALAASEGYVSSSTWRCNDVARGLSLGLEPAEPEGAVSQRIPALRGRSVLSLKEGWTCAEETVPIPPGYEPDYAPDHDLDCSNFSPSDLDPLYTFIDVRLSTHNRIGEPINAPFNTSTLVSRVRKGNTLLQVMAQAQCEGNFQFQTVETSFGPSVRIVNGVLSDRAQRQYWRLVDADTQTSLPRGAGGYIPSNMQHILFKLSTF